MSSNVIVQEQEIAASRDRVFNALTDARELERWWPTTAKSEPRKNGEFRYDWTFTEAADRDHVQEGRYMVLEEGERIAYPWKAGPVQTEVDFQLRDNDDGTVVRLEHRGWQEGLGDAYERHDQGWAFFLGNLKSYLEEGVDRRADALGMKVGR